MNNFNNIFDNLLPLRPLFPFVQSVLPTVFDDSLSYLETLGKVVKALNDTESNVNTLEQAVRAFADDLAAFENLTIYPVNMTFNENTGNYTADKTFADIDAALLEGRTPVLHVLDRDGRNYYSAQLAKAGNTVFYWTTPLFYENGESVIFRAFINSSDVSGVIASPIDSGAVVVNYTTVSGSDTPVVDKTFEQISAALEDNKPVFLFVDSAYWIPLTKANRSGNDVDGYHYISAEFIYAIPVSTTGGNNLGVGVYSVNTSDVWSVTRYAFPDTGKVNALIDARIATLDGFNSIKKLIYNESTGNVVYYDGASSTPITGEEVQINFLSNPKIYVVLEGGETVAGNTAYNLYVPLRYGFVNGANIGIQFYRVFNGNIEFVTLPANSSVATKTVTPIDLPYITPQMFGAKGDGVTDDTAAIQACIDACYTGGNYKVFFPKGTYIVTSPIVLYFSFNQFWSGKGITIEGEHQGNTVIIKQGSSVYKNVDTVFYCACGDSQNKNDGSGVSVFNLRIENQSSTAESYCINGDNYARGEFKRLTLVGNYGIKCTGYSNIYDDIIGNTSETFFEDAGTSNLVGKIGCFGAHNPYVLRGVYSTYNVIFGDGCTGTFVEIWPFGNSHINSIGTESPELDCVVQAGSDSSTAKNKTITIDNIYCDNLTTENAKYIIVKEARVRIGSLAILYQNAQAQNTLCYFDGTYGCCQLGEVSNITNVVSFNKALLSLHGNMGTRNQLFINSTEFTGYINSLDVVALGGNSALTGIADSNRKNKFQSVVMGGYLEGSGQYAELKTTHGTMRYRTQPPKGSLILNDLTESTMGVAGFVSLETADDEPYGNSLTNKAPIPVMYTTAQEYVPDAAKKNGTLLFDTADSKLKVYYNNAWVEV